MVFLCLSSLGSTELLESVGWHPTFILENIWLYVFKYFLCPMFPLSFRSGTPSMSDCLTSSRSSWMLSSVLFYFSVCFGVDNFYWPVFELIDSFQRAIKCFQRILHFRYYIFQFKNFQLKCFSAKFPIYENVLSTFSFEFFFFKRFYLFLERGEGREKERERNIYVWLPPVCPLLGTWPATQACALTGNRTGTPLVHSWSWIHWATPAGLHWIL